MTFADRILFNFVSQGMLKSLLKNSYFHTRSLFKISVLLQQFKDCVLPSALTSSIVDKVNFKIEPYTIGKSLNHLIKANPSLVVVGKQSSFHNSKLFNFLVFNGKL